MKNKNDNLHSAKRNKNDEFYTTYEDIEKEISHYHSKFENKVVFCNCDDPFESNFSKFFLKNFRKLKLKRLICTSYIHSPLVTSQSKLKEENSIKLSNKNGYILDINDIPEECINSDEKLYTYLNTEKKVKRLNYGGDFQSDECVEYLKLSDIIVTNPPFSLFREFVSLMIKYNKQFLVVSNQNAITYKEIFPLIKNNIVWTGYQFGEMKFRVPEDSEPRSTRYWVDETGQKWRSLGNAMWLTNLDNERRHKEIKLEKKYNTTDYLKYDNYDAINVKSVNDIPSDYYGVMGVPITFINRYNKDQFEIIGEANHGSDNEYDLFKPVINGKEIFKRILIKRKVKNYKFNVLDLFSGAGGFAYGLEQNLNFNSVIALDNNEKALTTYKFNMPHAETVVGDITDEAIKHKVVDLSIEKRVNMIIGGPPCQGFSLKGKKMGINDERNFLFREYLELVERINPEVFIIENVKAILSTSAGWFKDQIVSKVEKLGYFVNYGILNSADFGVPQSRQRAIFICSKSKKIDMPTPLCGKIVTVRDAISDLAFLNSGEGLYEQNYLYPPLSEYQVKMRSGNKLYNHIASNHAEIAITKLKMIPPECGKEQLPENMLGKQKFSGTWGRLKWDQVSPTIDTRFDASSNGTNNHPFLHRAITPREAARIQSFDDGFIFLGKKVDIRTQIGNAVPPLLAKALADKISEEILGE